MKKLIVVLLSIVMSITVLVGCKSEDKASSDINKQSENSVASLFDKAINDVSLEVEKNKKEEQEKKAKEQEEQKKKEEEEEAKEEQEKKAKEDEQKKKAEEEKNKQSQNKTIVVDPGHSSSPLTGQEAQAPGSSIMKAKDTIGAVSPYSGLYEYKINLEIARKLKAYLSQKGFNVIMTKNSEKEDKSNIDRAEIGNNNNADLVIRIHCDSFTNANAKGASMLVPSSKSTYASSIYQKSKLYGQKIFHEYLSNVPINNRGIIERDDLTGFNWSKVPVVLIELGYLSNANDSAYLSDAKNYDIIAKALADGIELCFN